MPSYGASFAQLEMYFSQIDAASPSTSAQATWLAGAAEARQLADELTRKVNELKQFWSGPAATEYYKAMDAIIQFANSLSTDMQGMSTGLASMAGTAAAIQPQAMAIINAARSNPYSRAAAIAPLNALLNQLGGSYLSDKGSHWKEPAQPPERLPKAGSEGDSVPTKPDQPPEVPKSPILGVIEEIAKYANLGRSVYDAFNPDEFPSGVVGNIPGGNVPGGNIPGGNIPGPGGEVPGWNGPGPAPTPDDPDFQPLPEPSEDLTESPVNLAGAGPSMSGASPAVSLAVGGGNAMGAPGGPMPMGGMGMGMAGAAGAAAKPAVAPTKSGGGGGGMMGAPMGAARGAANSQQEEGERTWLTEDELTWDSDPAPSGIVSR